MYKIYMWLIVYIKENSTMYMLKLGNADYSSAEWFNNYQIMIDQNPWLISILPAQRDNYHLEHIVINYQDEYNNQIITIKYKGEL